MLTDDQQKYFFDLFKNGLYNRDKLTIETYFDEIEESEIRNKRNKLLREAEKNAVKSAKKLVNKIKYYTTDELENVLIADQNNDFGNGLLKEINEELDQK